MSSQHDRVPYGWDRSRSPSGRFLKEIPDDQVKHKIRQIAKRIKKYEEVKYELKDRLLGLKLACFNQREAIKRFPEYVADQVGEKWEEVVLGCAFSSGPEAPREDYEAQMSEMRRRAKGDYSGRWYPNGEGDPALTWKEIQDLELRHDLIPGARSHFDVVG